MGHQSQQTAVFAACAFDRGDIEAENASALAHMLQEMDPKGSSHLSGLRRTPMP